MSRALPSLLVALAACGPPTTPASPPTPTPATATAAPAPTPPPAAVPAFVVATDCEPATRAAAKVLAEGGHAADAAIVAVLVAGLAHPSSSGLGGGGLALTFDATTGEPKGYDFRITAPESLEKGSPWTLNAPPEARVGRPGELAGLTALQAHAKRSWARHIEDAIAVAADLKVTPHLSRMLAAHPEMGAAFGLPTGRMVEPGTPLSRPKLVATLRKLADLDAAIPASFAPGAVTEIPLLQAERDGRQVITTSSAGGHVLWESLSLLPAALPTEPVARRHLLAEAFGLAVEDRMRHAGAGGHLPLSKTQLEARRALLDPKRHRPIPAAPHDEGGTTNITIVDADGNAVVWSSSLGHSFGAGVVTEEGIVLNDGLSLFARPAERRRFGDANAPRPGAAPAVSLAPTLVVRDGAVVAALAASGGEHVPTALAQVVLRLDDDDPVAAPRLRTPVAGGLWLEAGEAELAPGLRARGHHVRADLADHTGVVMVTLGAGGRRGFVDPRRGGANAISPPAASAE